MTPSPLSPRSRAALLCAAALLCLSACQRRNDVPSPDTTRQTLPDTPASAPLPAMPASPASAVSSVP